MGFFWASVSIRLGPEPWRLIAGGSPEEGQPGSASGLFITGLAFPL